MQNLFGAMCIVFVMGLKVLRIKEALQKAIKDHEFDKDDKQKDFCQAR